MQSTKVSRSLSLSKREAMRLAPAQPHCISKILSENRKRVVNVSNPKT